MSGLWLHFTAGALALSSSLYWLLFRLASLVVENGYNRTSPHTFDPHSPDEQSSCGPEFPEKVLRFTVIGWAQVTCPLLNQSQCGWGVEPTDCSTPGLKTKSPQSTAGRAGRRSYRYEIILNV